MTFKPTPGHSNAGSTPATEASAVTHNPIDTNDDVMAENQPQPHKPLLALENIHVDYTARDGSTTSALTGVNLSLRPGEIMALVGESGSGKSTLTKVVNALLPEAASIPQGKLSFNGETLFDIAPGARAPRAAALRKKFRGLRGRHIGLVPQDPGASLNPVHTIGFQLTEMFRIHDVGVTTKQARDARAVELLEQVGIDRPEQRLKQYPHELSGGLKQRVLIAMGFALQPELLIADEPTSALDVTVQKRVLEVFDKLARDTGSAVLFVTHDIALATDYADRIIVLRHGKIVEDRPAQRIAAAPEHDYTKQLIHATGHSTAPDAGAEGKPQAEIAGHTQTESHKGGSVPALEVENLSKYFGSGHSARKAVDNVSLTVQPGTTYSLVGESGSGKSTTARMIMRLLDPNAGTIRLHGQDITHASGPQLRTIWRDLQMVYQNPDSALDPRMKIADIVAEPLKNHRIEDRKSRAEQVAQALEQVRLPASAAQVRPRELSGGQRQRVAIARALITGAKTLVLDEALSALDVLTQEHILGVLDELQKELGLTYLFISHDLSVVERISHTVGVMKAGQLVETGPAAEIFADPQHPYTQNLLASAPGHVLASVN